MPAPVVASPKLAEHADQALAAKRVDLVEEQHQRPRAGLGPRRERRPQQVVLRGIRPRGWLELARKLVGGEADLVEDAALRGAVVVAGGSPDLAAERQRRVPPGGRQLVRKRPDRRRLASPPGGVDDEIALLPDKPGYLR